MMSPVAIHAVSSDANESAQQTQALREWNQMLELARQILSESCAALSKTLGALVDVQKAWLSTIGEAGDEMFSEKYAKDFWPAFCREWLGKSPYLLLAHIALLGAVYGNLLAARKLLSYVAEQLQPAWAWYARLLLMVGFENDMATAEAVYKEHVAPSAPEGELKKIRTAMKTLRDIAQLRRRIEGDVLNQTFS